MNLTDPTDLENLPGENLIRKGLDDFHYGRDTIEACLVQICSPKLARCGWELDPDVQHLQEPEMHLYSLLMASGGDAYSRYNALLRTLASFGRAIESRRQRDMMGA